MENSLAINHLARRKLIGCAIFIAPSAAFARKTPVTPLEYSQGTEDRSLATAYAPVLFPPPEYTTYPITEYKPKLIPQAFYRQILVSNGPWSAGNMVVVPPPGFLYDILAGLQTLRCDVGWVLRDLNGQVLPESA